MMRRGAFDENAATVAMDAIDATGTLVPGNMGESNAQAVTLEQLDVMHDARQRRIAINGSGVSWFECGWCCWSARRASFAFAGCSGCETHRGSGVQIPQGAPKKP